MPYSVYLLRSVPAPLRTYVGVSNNVEARLRAHNGLSGKGAAATRAQRPWEVYAVISGFESEHKALCFEYAWHYPKKVGYAVLHVHLVKSMKETYASLRRLTRDWVRGDDGVEWHLRVLDEMLDLELWRGMHLNVEYPLGRMPLGAPAAPVLGAPVLGAPSRAGGGARAAVACAGLDGRALVPSAGRTAGGAAMHHAGRVRARGAGSGAGRVDGRGSGGARRGAGGAGRGAGGAGRGAGGAGRSVLATAGWQKDGALVVVVDEECASVSSASSDCVVLM